MKNSKFQTLLFSAAGVVLVFIAIVGLNLIVSPTRARVDLTADQLHTLSDGTKQILKRVDGTRTVAAIIAELKALFDNAPLDDDVRNFLAQAQGNGWITF